MTHEYFTPNLNKSLQFENVQFPGSQYDRRMDQLAVETEQRILNETKKPRRCTRNNNNKNIANAVVYGGLHNLRLVAEDSDRYSESVGDLYLSKVDMLDKEYWQEVWMVNPMRYTLRQSGNSYHVFNRKMPATLFRETYEEYITMLLPRMWLRSL